MYKKLQPKIPPRQWGIFGYRGYGKTAFVGAMRQPILAIDTDHHIQHLANRGVDVFMLSDDPAVLREPTKISELLFEFGAGEAKTVAFDSLTAILKPLNAMAMSKNRSSAVKNKASSFVEKANAMELIIGSVLSTGSDFAFVWHLEKGKDGRGADVEHPTVSETEKNKLKRALNVVIRIDHDPALKKRYAKVVWNRENVAKKPDGSPLIFYDDHGWWQGVPEQIEAALYSSLAQSAA